jgi:hypothetical protein
MQSATYTTAKGLKDDMDKIDAIHGKNNTQRRRRAN